MEEFLKSFGERVGRWLETDTKDSDVILSTRIRLARNVAGFPFVSKLQNGKAGELQRQLREGILTSGIATDLLYFPLAEASAVCRQTFLERHLISRELAASKIERGVAFDPQESISIMVNEEDHLRLQVLRPGFAADPAWQEMSRIDRLLESRLEFSFSKDFGYLTACPTNVGTGMRVSVMLHLPALGMVEKELKRIFNAAAKTNLAVRGLHGEGTKAVGDFYQVSNQVTLGRSEAEILRDIQQIAPQILDFERKVRQTLAEGKRRSLEDRVHRAFALLRGARSISSDEAIGHLSAVRLGINLDLIPELDLAAVNRLLILTQPGHLQARLGKELSPEERDFERAKLLRSALGGSKR